MKNKAASALKQFSPGDELNTKIDKLEYTTMTVRGNVLVANIRNTASTFNSLKLFIISGAQPKWTVLWWVIPSWVTGLGPLGMKQVLPFNIDSGLLDDLDKYAQ